MALNKGGYTHFEKITYPVDQITWKPINLLLIFRDFVRNYNYFQQYIILDFTSKYSK